MRLISDEALAIATIWAEARGESLAGKRAVAEVIRNRTDHHYMSDGTVAGTVLHPYQFSCWNTKDPNRIAAMQITTGDPGVADCIQAWRDADVEASDDTQGAVIYFNPDFADPKFVAKVRVECERTVTLGRHEFYRPRS